MITVNIMYVYHTHPLTHTSALTRTYTRTHNMYIYMHIYIATAFIYTPESCLKRAVTRLNRASIAP